jgi:hypothetical protein
LMIRQLRISVLIFWARDPTVLALNLEVCVQTNIQRQFKSYFNVLIP